MFNHVERMKNDRNAKRVYAVAAEEVDWYCEGLLE